MLRKSWVSIALTLLLTLASLPASGQEVCPTIACPGAPAACSAAVPVSVPTYMGNMVERIFWFANLFGGTAVNANCPNPAGLNPGYMGTFTFVASPTAASPSCFWQARIRTYPGAQYFNGPTCRINNVEDNLPVELLDFDVELGTETSDQG